MTKNQKTRSRSATKTSSKKDKNVKKEKSISPHIRLLQLIHSFLNDVECAQDMFTTVIPALKREDEKAMQKIDKTLKLLRKDNKSEGRQNSRSTDHIRVLLKYAGKLNRAETMFRGNALVGIVSRYDEFLSSILKNVYRTKPERATSPEKGLTYDELLTLDSLDNVVELFIGKEIENLLRESHWTQIKAIDKDFKTGIIENFSEFPKFIEIMERRNLLVHAGGEVSKYYLKLCNDVGHIKKKQPKEGEVLFVSEKYFQESVACLFELAVRLGYALAFRIYPDKLEDIHGFFQNDVGFPLLMSEKWELASCVFSFALSWPKKYIPEEIWTRFYVINAAIAHNQLGRRKEALALLNEYDWSAMEPRFILGVAVLRHEWKKAEKLMSEMSKESPFSEDAYRNWPIFIEYRKTQEFRRVYKSIYKKRFVVRLSKDESDLIKKKSEQID